MIDARLVSEKIGVPFRILNLMDFYHQHVVEPMVEGYAGGITPNPDVLCNREMKFGALLDYALKEEFLCFGNRSLLSQSGIA